MMSLLAAGRSVRGAGEVGQELADVGVDVVADQAHPLHPFDAALRGLIGVPGRDRRGHALDGFDDGFVADDDHVVDASQQLGGCLLYTSDAADEAYDV